MVKSLRIKFFLLLIAVSAIALSAALLLRELLVRDFREYLEGEMEDRVYWVTAALESAYEKNGAWAQEAVVEDAVWALMLGLDVRLYDAAGGLVIDTDHAVATLSPLVSKRVRAISEQRGQEKNARYVPYALFLGGREIGRLDVHFLRPSKEHVFISRSNTLLLISLIGLGGIAVLLSVVSARRLTKPIRGLTEAASAIGAGDLTRRVAATGKDELSVLSEAFNRMALALEKQEGLRRKLTANIAHELRTPIAAVRGELEGMMDGYIPMDKEHVQSLYAEINRLRKIIEAIEELSNAEASSLNLDRRQVDLRPFLTNIAERFGRLFAEKGVSLDVSCDDGLTVQADPERLSQIIINLLGNALKATAAGGGVRITASAKEGAVVIEVADNGVGIREEDLPYVFERFYRASEGGLGLGLAIVRELLDAHGGSIACRSEYGKGAAFTITLPR
ncbi:MAG: ATP-binding protein [Nitrospiraceae bacterium]|nr:ATP-binding protein [Nitrospiraceae bacterium]